MSGFQISIFPLKSILTRQKSSFKSFISSDATLQSEDQNEDNDDDDDDDENEDEDHDDDNNEKNENNLQGDDNCQDDTPQKDKMDDANDDPEDEVYFLSAFLFTYFLVISLYYLLTLQCISEAFILSIWMFRSLHIAQYIISEYSPMSLCILVLIYK